MEQNEDRSQNVTLYLLLGISFILVLVDSLELYHVILSWNYGMLIVAPVFETCVKWELYTKTIFAVFSLLGAISALILTVLLLIDTQWFADKILSTFLYFNYIIFGPYMLGFTILGFINWNNVVYICDNQNLNVIGAKNLSPANMFSLIGCFIMSGMITLLVSIYKTVILYIDSVLRKPDGNLVLRKLFWWSIFRNREPVDFVRRAQNENENRNANTNTNENLNNNIIDTNNNV